MSWLDGMRDRLRWLTRSEEAERQLEAELEFHLAMEAERLEAAGHAPDEARRLARRALGNLGQTREAVRGESGVAWLDDLRRDLAYAARGLRKRPGFAFAAIATLALGIGANTAVFSVVQAVVLRPLAYREPDRLVAVWADRFVSIRETRNFREQMRTLSSLAAYAPWRMALTGIEEPTQVMAARTSGNLFTTLGVRAELGRTYAARDDHPGAARVAVISHSLWRARFGGDSTVLGRTITLDGVGYEVLGVMPRTFEVLSGDAEVWVPLAEDPEAWYFSSGVSLLLGRLEPGASVATAQAELARVLREARVELGMPDRYGEGATVVELKQYLTGDYRTLLLVLLGAAGGILLLAAANLANLLLARATSRRPEMAMRIALGARRSRLVRQVLTEGLALSTLGAGAGVLLAVLMLRAFTGMAPGDMPRVAEIGLDASMLLVSACLALVMGAVFGLAQAGGISLRRTAPASRAAAMGGARITSRTGGLLIVSETALAVTLIIGAGLMIRTLGRLAAVDPGFQRVNVLSLRVQPAGPRYRENTQVDAFYRTLLDRVEAIPGVVSAGAIQHLPLSGTAWGISLEIEGQPVAPGEASPQAGFRIVRGEYFDAVGIPLLQGRVFDPGDRREGPRVSLVSQAMARRFWPGETVIGKRLRQPGDSLWTTVVGVVGDVRHEALDVAPEPELYFPGTQYGVSAYMLAVRTAAAPSALARAVQAAVWEVDPGVPVAGLATWDSLIRASLGDRRLLALVLGVFASVALVIGAIGVFGVTSYAVSRRTREIGIRMALGATRRDVRTTVYGRGMALALGGIAVGVAAALGLSRFLRSFLFEIGTADPATFAGVAILLSCVAAGAISGPASRATRVDPVKVLREE